MNLVGDPRFLCEPLQIGTLVAVAHHHICGLGNCPENFGKGANDGVDAFVRFVKPCHREDEAR